MENLNTLDKSIKRIPKIGTALIYLFLIIAALILFFGRNFQVLKIRPLLALLPDFYIHVSNLSISFIIYIIIGYIGLMMDIKFKYLIYIGLIIILINLVFEFVISLLNTPDKTDALYGFFGVLGGLVFLYVADKIGFKKMSNN